jgi:hypothetical protein
MTMPSSLALILPLFVLGPTLAATAEAPAKCPAGQVMVSGQCRPACPTTGSFAAPEACECPPGFGKVLHGEGGGECRRLTCALGVTVDPKLCDCPSGYKPKAAKKGQVKCVEAPPAKKATASAKAPAPTK